MDSSNLKFWQKDWLTSLGISSRQSRAIIFLIAVLISGLVIPKIRDNAAKQVFFEEQSLDYSNFQNKVAEIESLYYAERNHSNLIKTISLQKKIDINEASEKELMILPGIGPQLSKRILEFRKKNGKFVTLEDLKKVKGIGEKKFNKFLPYIKLTK